MARSIASQSHCVCWSPVLLLSPDVESSRRGLVGGVAMCFRMRKNQRVTEDAFADVSTRSCLAERDTARFTCKCMPLCLSRVWFISQLNQTRQSSLS